MLYLSHPVGAAVGGAVLGKVVEKIIDAAVKWGSQRAVQRNRRIDIYLYGPDGKRIWEGEIQPGDVPSKFKRYDLTGQGSCTQDDSRLS